MIRIRKVAQHKHGVFKGRSTASCDACPYGATMQIVAQTVHGNTPTAASVNLCDACASKLVAQFDKRNQKATLKKLGVK